MRVRESVVRRKVRRPAGPYRLILGCMKEMLSVATRMQYADAYSLVYRGKICLPDEGILRCCVIGWEDP